MLKKLLPLVVLTLLAFMLLSGCEQPGAAMAVIIGSINIDPDIVLEATHGGTEYHVLLYTSGTIVDPDILGSVEAVEPAAEVAGLFPGTISDWYFTINYMITDVPAGAYFALVWIDYDLTGTFDPINDYFGFYDANASGTTIWTQPTTPNVIVPATGIIDVDIWCRYQIVA
jgi:uncharacterized protein Usg